MSLSGIVLGAAALGAGFVVGVVTYRENTEQVEAVAGKHIDKAVDMYHEAKEKIESTLNKSAAK